LPPPVCLLPPESQAWLCWLLPRDGTPWL
jgi:hypothetical protein